MLPFAVFKLAKHRNPGSSRISVIKSSCPSRIHCNLVWYRKARIASRDLRHRGNISVRNRGIRVDGDARRASALLTIKPASSINLESARVGQMGCRTLDRAVGNVMGR